MRIIKSAQAQISDTTTTGFGSKNGIGKAGVNLCWHDKPEYKKLNKDQKQELWQWQEQNPGTGGDGGPPKKKVKKAMAEAINKKVAEHLAAKEKEKEQQVSSDESIRNYII